MLLLRRSFTARLGGLPAQLRCYASSSSPAPRKGMGKSSVLSVPEACSAERLSKLIRLPLPQLLKTAEQLGERIKTPRSPLNRELIELLGMECGVDLKIQEKDARSRGEAAADEPLRAPVVTLMGHVDHGKTSLLDAFRGSSLAEAEAGGITQGISAFMVDPDTPRAITFIDTPGHALFTAMRERGAHATDIILLVVAIDAGVQPTTLEAIRYAREVHSPMVVAANKVDKSDSQQQLAKLQQQLLEAQVELEEFGGDVPIVPVSATKELHLDELRDALLLQAEMLELRASERGAAEGVVLEAYVHKGLGIVATAIVKRGTLRQSDVVVVGKTWGRVRVMQDELGHKLSTATVAMPLRFNGLRDLPQAGDEFLVVESEAKAKQVREFRAAKAQAEEEAAREARRGKRSSSAKKVPALLKVDSQGSLEAAREGISHFPRDRVDLKLVRGALGPINEADVLLAASVGGFIVGFNAPLPNKVAALAVRKQVSVHTYRVIYELVDGVKGALEAAMDPVSEEHVTGTAEVLEVFTLSYTRKERREGMGKFTQVAGARVSSGVASSSSQVRVHRDEEEVHDGRVISLRHFKQEVRNVKKGSECGLILYDFSGFEKGDIMSFYEIRERMPNLYDGASTAQKTDEYITAGPNDGGTQKPD